MVTTGLSAILRLVSTSHGVADPLRELEILIQAHHPLVLIESIEDDRVEALLEHACTRLGMPLVTWRPHKGLCARLPVDSGPVHGTEQPARCLAFIEEANQEAVYHLRDFAHAVDDPIVIARLKEIYQRLRRHRGAVVLSGASIRLPREVDALFASVTLTPPSPEAYRALLLGIVAEVGARRQVVVDLTPEQIDELLSSLRGLTFFEVRKVLTRALVEDGRLTADDLALVIEEKRRVVERSGALEYFPVDRTLSDVAGLRRLKEWLTLRGRAFAEPARARAFGLDGPRGLLLLGVQGCGKSLCAKAVAAEWHLPLVRLDPSALYQKYIGDTEKNLRRAIELAEQLAPIVLWVDELEKAFGDGSGESDAGTSRRVLGTFLSWLQDKPEGVFIVATANDVSRLPPELLRKGRFDEIFFVDLPDAVTRAQIFGVHLKRRGREPDDFDLEELASSTDGFSGAEIEQVVVSALYTVFAEGQDLHTDALMHAIMTTVPLSVTLAEPIARLRDWARDRAVPAD